MNTLAGINLPDQIIWAEQYQSQRVAGTAQLTLDGGMIISQQALTTFNMTLEAREETAWFAQADVDALQALQDTPGAQFTLVLYGVTYTVIPRHHDAPAFEFSPLWPFYDRYTGRLKLMRI